MHLISSGVVRRLSFGFLNGSDTNQAVQVSFGFLTGSDTNQAVQVSFGFLTGSDTNQAVQIQKLARGWKCQL